MKTMVSLAPSLFESYSMTSPTPMESGSAELNVAVVPVRDRVPVPLTSAAAGPTPTER